MGPALFLLVLTHLVAPPLLAALLAWWRLPSRLHAALLALVAGSYAAWIALAGRWDWFGYPLRYLCLLLLALAAAASARRLRSLPALPVERRRWLSAALLLAFVVPFAAAAVPALRGRAVPPAGVRLAFPLRRGTYYVAHGGSTRHVNYHHSYPPQRYAVDLTALRLPGLRATGILPRALSRYVIFGRTVHSPCDGEVVAAVDSQPDLVPSRLDRGRPAGNHVVLRCGEVLVLLAHLQAGSVGVRAGQAVAEGAVLARVGNSGHTTEPHLHLHAVRATTSDPFQGEAVPMVFEGRFLVRNHLVVADQDSAVTYWRW